MIEQIISDYGTSISKKQFQEIYDVYHDICEEKYGKPERSFISVVSFGDKVRQELKELLDNNGITVYTESQVDEYELKTSGFDRLSEIQNKLL